MEQTFKALGISRMSNADNWLPIQYNNTRTTSDKCGGEQSRRSDKLQTDSNNRSVYKRNIPNFKFPGPGQARSEVSAAPSSTHTQDCSCKCSSSESLSFIQANRKKMQYERLGIPITIEEVMAMKKFNSQNSNKTPKPESQAKNEKLQRFHDSSTQTDLNQYLNDSRNKEPSYINDNDDNNNNFKSQHSDSEEKKYFTASKEKEGSKRYRDIGKQEHYKNTSRSRPATPSEMSSSSDECQRAHGSLRKSKRCFSMQAERKSRMCSSDSKKRSYLNHSLRRTSDIYGSDENDEMILLPHSNTRTKRSPSSQSKHCSCSCASTKSNSFYGRGGPKQKSESDDNLFLSYSSIQKKRAPSRHSKNCIWSCESTNPNYLYCGPDRKSDDIQFSRHSNVQHKRASNFHSKPRSNSFSYESSKAYHFNGDPDSKSDDTPSFMPKSRVQANRVTSHQPKYRKYSYESPSDNHFLYDPDPSSDDTLSFIRKKKAQAKSVSSCQSKFGKYSYQPKSPCHYIDGSDPELHDTSYRPKYRRSSCESPKAKYLNRYQERKSNDFQHFLPQSKFHNTHASSKYCPCKFCNSSQSSDDETKPSDSSEPVYSKCFREASASPMKYDKNKFKISTKHHNRKTTPRCPYEDFLKSINIDDHRHSLPRKRYDKYDCVRNPTRERDFCQEYTPRSYRKSEPNSKGSERGVYKPLRGKIREQASSSHDSYSVSPLHYKYNNNALADNLVELNSSGTITDVWHRESATNYNEISTQSDDRLSGGSWTFGDPFQSKNVYSKSSSNIQYIGKWDDLFCSMTRKTISKRLMQLREFQYFAELSFKRSNMEKYFSWNGKNATEINLCKCPIGSRTCEWIVNESLLSHFINQHLAEPGIELREIFERDRLLLVFNAKALQLGKNACMSVLTYGGFRGQPKSKPALRFMPVKNQELPWLFEKFWGYLPLMLMICRIKRNAFEKFSSIRKRVHFQDDDHRHVQNTDEDLIVLWVASIELPKPIYVMLTVFNKTLTTTRTSIVKVRSIKESHDITDFKSNDQTHMLLPDADIKILSNFNGDAIYLELSIHEYFHNYPRCAKS